MYTAWRHIILATCAIVSHASPASLARSTALERGLRTVEVVSDYQLTDLPSNHGYELMAPSFRYEFSAKADEYFNMTCTAMRAAAYGFLAHATVESLSVLLEVYFTRKTATLLQLGSCIDELIYAFLILQASTHFRAIVQSQGRDIENLMDGIRQQTRLWARMCKPLFLKTLLIVLHMAWRIYSRVCLADAAPQTILLPWILRFRDAFSSSQPQSTARAARLLERMKRRAAGGEPAHWGYSSSMGGYERYLGPLG